MMNYRVPRFCSILVCLLLISQWAAAQQSGTAQSPAQAKTAPDSTAEQTFEFNSWKDLEAFFEMAGYTEAEWDKGLRVVPRFYATNIPNRWRAQHSREVEVRTKKEVFFRIMAPLILRSNEEILRDRQRLEQLGKQPSLDQGEADWLRELAINYKVTEADAWKGPDAAVVDELLLRVDAIPPSLAMAQSAEESGWGTSRFADVGNAMFGQWAWGDKAIKPEQQRQGKGNYGIAAFDTPQGSVSGYMRNINTHRAYAGLRATRAQLRSEGKQANGMDLSPTLSSYSERGEHYVKTLNSIMRVNKLLEIDEAFLDDGPVTWLVPAGEGAD
jgi:Bax protein